MRTISWTSRVLMMLGLLGLFLPAPGWMVLHAQEQDTVRITLGDRAPKPAGARTITGIVVDTQSVAMDSVDIYIADVRRNTSSAADGTFRFADIKAGTYRVAARRFGFYPQVQTVVVGAQGGVVTFVLVPMGNRLPPIVSSSPRGGLSGVIGDTAYNIIEGALIELMATGRRAVSDSTGAFYIAAPAGRYMVRIRREGYATRVVGVTIPKDSGRRILAWMMPATRPSLAREEVAMFDLGQRLKRANPVWSKLYTREDINRMAPTDLIELASRGAGRRVDPTCMVIVDGHHRVPIWGLVPADVESIEIYQQRPGRNATRSIMSGGTRQPLAVDASGGCGASIYVWLRK